MLDALKLRHEASETKIERTIPAEQYFLVGTRGIEEIKAR
jgi:hypothetical protein